MSKRKILTGNMIIMFFLITLLINDSGLVSISIIVNILASLVTLMYLKDILGNYSNLFVVFYAFNILYGLSGPIAVYWGEGLNKIFGNIFEVSVFLSAYALSNIGIIVGVILYHLINSGSKIKKENILKVKYIGKLRQNTETIGILSIVLSFFAFVFEITNFIRVGGLSAILQGKAFYQSAIASLTLTLPSDMFIELSFALLALHIAIKYYDSKPLKKNMLFLIFFFSIPYVLVALFLGQRANLLYLIVILFIGITLLKPIKKIKTKLILYFILIYVIMAILYANRAFSSFIFTDFSLYLEYAFDKERIITALNPGGQEFGAPFGNFNMFYVSTQGNFNKLLGKSYLLSFILPIPSFLYLGEKPQQITYIFRELFFPSEIARGSIAGTAFSAILESYWNFGFLGIILMFIIFGYALMYLERKFKLKSIENTLIYLMLVPAIVMFFRSSISNLIARLVIVSIIILLFVFPIKNFIKEFTNKII